MKIPDRRLTLVFAVLALLLPGAHTVAADLPPLSHSLTAVTPKPAPPLTLQDLDGKTHDLAALKGRVVLVNFWATWCPPCRREMPSMERLSQALKGAPFSVLAVDVAEDPQTIEAFVSQLDTPLGFPILLDPRAQTMQAWQVAGLPTTFLIDRKGRIVATAIGGREFDHPELTRKIGELLAR